MENTQRWHLDPNKWRYFVLGLAILFCSFLISLSIFVAYSASRVPPQSSPNWLIHPMTIYSPFTLHRGNAFQGATDRLRVPLYPGAIPRELNTFAWKEDQSSSATDPMGLAVVYFQVKAPSLDVNSWYQGNLPKPYSQLRKEQILSGPAKEQWFQKLDVDHAGDTTLYQTTDSSRVRGVIVESLGNGTGTSLTLFYYSEGR